LIGAGQRYVCTAVLVLKINPVLILCFSGWEVEEGNNKDTTKDTKDEVVGRHGYDHVQGWMVYDLQCSEFLLCCCNRKYRRR